MLLLVFVAEPAWAQFETRATRSIPSGSNAIVVGDFNHDGKLDLATAGGQGLAVALGNGDGTFRPPTTYPDLLGSALAVGDFNGDGKLDIVITPSTATGEVDVLLGNGDGTFQTPKASSTTEFPSFIAVGDFNGDHKLDIVIIDTPYVSVLLGNGDGTFQPPSDDESFVGPHNLAVGDFNNDRKLDVAVVGFFGGSQDFGLLLGSGDGTLQSSLTYPLTFTPATVAVGDFNHDGNLDAAIEDADSGATVMLGNGTGGFQSVEQYSTPSGFAQIELADFNGDGVLDLALAGFIDPPGLNVLAGNGDGTFQTARFYPAGRLVQFLAVGDFNGDHQADVVLSDRDFGAITLLNTGVVDFSPTTEVSFAAQAIHASSTQTVTLTNSGTTSLSLSSMAASGEFQASSTCGKRVSPGATCKIMVTFQPQTVGGASGLVTIHDSASSKPQVIELFGSGTALLLTPPTLSFDSQKVGTTSPPQQIMVSNKSVSTVLISQIQITGVAPKDFAESNNCGSQLEANASCVINVTFTPSKTGTRKASMKVILQSGTNPQPVSLTGVGG